MSVEKVVDELIAISSKISCKEALNLLAAVKDSAKRSSFHIAVLGEFKRGKSSLINSLLGNNLLPVDVLPATATINIVEYGANECEILWNDGRREKCPLSAETLARFSVNGDLDATQVRYLLVKLDHPFLKDGFVLIDTPGVNDLSQSRQEVTYQILPHCDAALFLLDSAAALTRSEADFLVNKVFSSKLDSILFILSKIDRLSEEEQEEALSGARERIAQVTGSERKVIAYSAKYVQQAAENGKRHHYLEQLLHCLDDLRQAAQKGRDERRLAQIKLAAQLILNNLKEKEAIARLDEQQLTEYYKRIESAEEDIKARFDQLLASAELVGRQTLIKMFRKSCERLRGRLIRELELELRSQEGNVEKYWRRNMPLQLERALRSFSEIKAQEIRRFLGDFTRHLGQEYQRNFSTTVSLKPQQNVQLPEWQADIEVDEERMVENLLNQTLPGAVGGIIGSLFMPGIGTIIGFVGGGVLASVMNTRRNESLKTALLVEIPGLVSNVVSTYQSSGEQAINSWFDALFNSLTEYHAENYSRLKNRITEKYNQPESTSDISLEEIRQLQERTSKLADSLN